MDPGCAVSLWSASSLLSPINDCIDTPDPDDHVASPVMARVDDVIPWIHERSIQSRIVAMGRKADRAGARRRRDTVPGEGHAGWSS